MSLSRERDFKVGDWWARPRLKELRRGDEVVRVEARSIEVLGCLAYHAPAVVSKDQILSEVWAEAHVGDEVISHAVWELRRAFEDDARRPRYIQTVARKGYRLVAEVQWFDGDGQPEVGARIGPYEISEQLGQGAMGVVFKARDRRLDRTVALKFLAPELTRDEEARQRFLREARLAAAFDHPHLGTLYEIGETREGRQFLVTAFYSGGSLADRLKEGPVALEEGARLAAQLARGLAAMHRRGIIHRDVKPANVLLNRVGVAKLVDFGIARLVDGTRLTRTGASLGTPSYKSPEQSRGEEVDHRSDIWSLGVVLFEMLSGQKPFRGDYEQAVVRAILEEDPLDLEDLGIACPMSVQQTLSRALAKDPAERFQDADELAEALEAALPDAEGRSRIVTALPAGFEQPPKRARSRRALSWLAVAGVLLLAAWWGARELMDRRVDGEASDIENRIQSALKKGSDYESQSESESALEAANDSYRSALELDPGHPESLARLSLNLTRLHQLDPVRGTLEEARFMAQRASQIAPGLWLTWMAKAKLSWLDQKYKRAVEEAHEAVKRAPKADDDRDLPLALLGMAQVEIGDVEQGLKNLARAAQTSRGGVRSQLIMARCLENLGRLDEAALHYQKALDIDRNSVTGLSNLGLLYRRMGRKKDALARLGRAWELGPTDAQLANNLGAVYYDLAVGGEDDYWPKAIDIFKRAIALRPYYAEAHVGLGDTYLSVDESEKAQLHFKRAVEAYDRDIAAGSAAPKDFARRAVCLAKKGELGVAIAEIQRLIAKFPGFTRLGFDAARIYALAGETEEVYRLAREAVTEGVPVTDFYSDPSFKAFQGDPTFKAILEGALP